MSDAERTKEEKTLRDEFAMAALQGIMANSGGPLQSNPMSGWGLTNTNEDSIAAFVWEIADAMMKQREK